jgi:hypothetical protein
MKAISEKENDMKPITLIVPGALSLGLIGCDRTESDWKRARDSKTVPAYTDFIGKHSQRAHVDEAKAAVENLDWDAAARFQV